MKKIKLILVICIIVSLSSCTKPQMGIESYDTNYNNNLKEMTLEAHELSAYAEAISCAYDGLIECAYNYKVDETINKKSFYLITANGNSSKKLLIQDEDMTKASGFVIGTDLEDKTVYLGFEEEDVKSFSGPRELDIPDYGKEELEKEVLDESVSIEKGKLIPLETYYAIDEDGNKKEVFSICVEFK